MAEERQGQTASGGVSIGLATLEEVDKFWPQVGPILSDACLKTGGDISAHDLYRMCRHGDAYLVIWSVDGEIGCCVVSVETWADGRWLRLLALYGKKYRKYKKDLWQFLDALAGQLGAQGLVTEGRLGWQRFEPDLELIKTVYKVRRK